MRSRSLLGDFLWKEVHLFSEILTADPETCIYPFTHHADCSVGYVDPYKTGGRLIYFITDGNVSVAEEFHEPGSKIASGRIIEQYLESPFVFFDKVKKFRNRRKKRFLIMLIRASCTRRCLWVTIKKQSSERSISTTGVCIITSSAPHTCIKQAA